MSPKAVLTSVASFDPNEGVLLDVAAIDKDSMRWRSTLSKLTHGVPTDPLEMNVEVNMLRHAWSNEKGVLNELPVLSPSPSSKRKRTKENSHEGILVDLSFVATTPIVVDTHRAVGRRNTRPKKKAQQTKHKQQLPSKWQLPAEGGFNPTPTKKSSVGAEKNSTLNTPSTKMSPSTRDFARSFFSDETFDSSGLDRNNVHSEQAKRRDCTPLPIEHAPLPHSHCATFDRSFFEWLQS